MAEHTCAATGKAECYRCAEIAEQAAHERQGEA